MSSEIKSVVNRSAASLITFGVLGVIAGVTFMVWPGITAVTFAIIWGVYAVVEGISALVLAFRQSSGRGWLILSGVLGLVAGLLVIFLPGTGLFAWGWLLGVWLLARGIAELVAAFAPENKDNKWIMLLGGVLWIIAGGLAVVNPLETAISLAWLFGLLAIVWGVVLIVAGFRTRSAAK